MLKKFIAITSLIGFAMIANVSTASAHKGFHYWNLPGKQVLNTHQVRHRLRHRGFHNIYFTDKWLPVYKVKACKHGKRFKLRLNRFGNIKWRKKIGWC